MWARLHSRLSLPWLLECLTPDSVLVPLRLTIDGHAQVAGGSYLARYGKDRRRAHILHADEDEVVAVIGLVADVEVPDRVAILTLPHMENAIFCTASHALKTH
jgi:hypothetical protein